MIAKSAWLHVVDRRLLCVRSHGRDAFYVPGGKPEAGETVVEALKREIVEELGVTLIDATIALYGRFTAPADGKPDVEVVIDAFTAACTGEPTPSAEIAELRWFGGDILTPLSAVTAHILAHLKAENVID